MGKVLLLCLVLMLNILLFWCQPWVFKWVDGVGLSGASSEGRAVIKFKEGDEEIIISDEYNGKPITQIGVSTSINIPKGIKRIFIGKNVSKIYSFNGLDLEEVSVHEENEHFICIDGVL